jgi:nitrite reductase/ring-hydroxylating ferredoxin subunit
MRLFRKPSLEPLWRDEFSVLSGDEKYVSRRQFSKFLMLTSLGIFVGNLWILVRSWFSHKPAYPLAAIARVEEIPIGGVKLFPYPGPQDQCILLRTASDAYVAYSQKCTHLSCSVFYAGILGPRRIAGTGATKASVAARYALSKGRYPVRERNPATT